MVLGLLLIFASPDGTQVDNPGLVHVLPSNLYRMVTLRYGV